MVFETFYHNDVENKKISLDLSEKTNDISNEYQLEVVERIIRFYNLMCEEQKSIDPFWLPQGEWKNYNDEKDFLYNQIRKNNVKEVNTVLKNFWRNKLGLIVKEYARFETLESGDNTKIDDFLSSIYRNYIIWKDLYNLDTDNLKMIRYVGNPWGAIIDNVLVTPKAIRYQHNTMQLINLLKARDGKVIAEIGAGYGALCHYLLKENFNLKYIDFDLPETLVLAAYYLLLNYPEKKIYLYNNKDFSPEIIDNYDVLLLPNYVINKLNDKSVDVFFNSFSLSEMPIEINAEYIKQILRLTKSFFLHNNMDRKGVINRGFERIPASNYPIDNDRFILLSKNYDVFHSHFGDYKEFLYQIKS